MWGFRKFIQVLSPCQVENEWLFSFFPVIVPCSSATYKMILFKYQLYLHISVTFPQVSKDLLLKIKNTILQRTVDGMQQEGVPYTGEHISVIVSIIHIIHGVTLRFRQNFSIFSFFTTYLLIAHCCNICCGCSKTLSIRNLCSNFHSHNTMSLL